MKKEKRKTLISEGTICLFEGYQSLFVYEGITYPSVQHAIVSLKTDSIEIKKQIASISLPADLKDFELLIPTTENWTREYILEWLYIFNLRKFRENPEFAKVLFAIEDEPIIDTPDHRVGYYGSLETDRDNHRGEILTKVRKTLRESGALFK